jgi:uncharacterized membrane protein
MFYPCCEKIELRAEMNERRIHQIFEVSVLLKGAHALIECIGGLALALVSTSRIAVLVNCWVARIAKPLICRLPMQLILALES